MGRYSENQIRALYSEFKSHKKYADKLAFFDQLFGIIPFSFPDFDPSLRFFFQKEKTDELAEIFKNERNNPGLTERKFFFGEPLIFNIKPANSNSAAYSNYILSSFLSRSPVFVERIRQNRSDERSVELMLDEANGIINKIEYCLYNEYDKSFKLQCMSVFFKGFYDAFSNGVNLPGKKRKFIELYLYSQGIIYSNYIGSLKRALYEDFRSPVDIQKPVNLDLQGKLDLLNELGIIDFLRTRYFGMDAFSFENKMSEILCLLTGEFTGQKESILKILSTMNRQNPNEILKRIPSVFHGKTVNLIVRK
ncbi:MAG TPA: hypothetical protein VII44_03370 [Puia sp.]